MAEAQAHAHNEIFEIFAIARNYYKKYSGATNIRTNAQVPVFILVFRADKVPLILDPVAKTPGRQALGGHKLPAAKRSAVMPNVLRTRAPGAS